MPGQEKIASISTVPPIRKPNWTPTRVVVGISAFLSARQKMMRSSPSPFILSITMYSSWTAVSRSERTARKTTARSGSASAAAGRMRWAKTDPKAPGSRRRSVSTSRNPVSGAMSKSGAILPEIGSQRRRAPKKTMKRSPQMKFGMERPRVPAPRVADSNQVRRQSTDSTPRRMPPATARTRAARATSSVAGSRSRMTRIASCWSQSDLPNRPRTVPQTHATY